MKGDLIGKGYTAEVYAWDNNEVLKLFYKDYSVEAIEKEYRISKVIGEEELHVPKAFGMLELEERWGIIYQRVDGISMMDLLARHPFSVVGFARQLADLQYQLHQSQGLEVPRYKEALEWNIRHTEALTKEQKAIILTRLEQLPDGDYLCHGDFHPGNIINKGDKYYILDWMTAANGVPAADVARTLLLIKDAAVPDFIPRMLRIGLGFIRQIMALVYEKRYYKISNIKKDEVLQWRLVIVAARLMESIPKAEKVALLKEIGKSARG